LVYLEKLRRLRAQGGLESESRNIDQENVENYSNTVTGSSSSYSSSGFAGSGYSSVRSQSGVSNNRFSEASISSNQTTDNYQEENQNAPQTSMSTNVDEIRKRLNKIKAQAF
jgi:hypothetical protein